MHTQITAQVTPQGLLIPYEIIEEWLEQGIEIFKDEERIIIQPKTLPLSQEREFAIQALRQDGLLVDWADISLSPPVTPEERLELAQKLSVGSSLSEAVIKERRTAW